MADGPPPDLPRLLRALRGGVPVKDRRCGLRTYPSSFLGSDAVAALQSSLGCSEAEALRVGNALINAGLIEHCGNDHVLQNRRLYYRFVEDANPVTLETVPMDSDFLLVEYSGPSASSPAAITSAPATAEERTSESPSHGSPDVSLEEDEQPAPQGCTCQRPPFSGAADVRRLWCWSCAVFVSLGACVMLSPVAGAALHILLASLAWVYDWPTVETPPHTASSPRHPPVGRRLSPPKPPIAVPPVPVLPPPESWQHRPLLLRFPEQLQGNGNVCGQLPINSTHPIPIETELFSGVAVVRIRNCPGAAPTSYFGGRLRTMQMAVQGRFKTDLPMHTVFTGEAQARPLAYLPPRWLVSAALAVVRRLSPGLQEDLYGAEPYALNLLAATAQAMRCDPPGAAPSVLEDVAEDTRRLGGEFERCTMAARQRKRFFSSPHNAAKFSFRRDSVYTFDFYQHLLKPLEFQLVFPLVGGFDLVRHLNGQPIHFMANVLPPSATQVDVMKSQPLWCFELWHERLLEK
eukprot:EG_transcript_9444